MKGKRRFFAAVLTLCLVLTGMPGAAFGADTAAAGDIVILYSSDMHGASQLHAHTYEASCQRNKRTNNVVPLSLG